MQKFKRKTKQRSTSSPEIVAAHTMENERGLSSTRHQFPDHCRTFDELLLSVRAVPLSGRNVDEGVSSTGTQLMHRGKRPHPEDWDTIRQSINHMVCVLDHESIDGWNPADNIQQRAIDEMDVWVHTAANVRGKERIQSSVGNVNSGLVSVSLIRPFVSCRNASRESLAKKRHVSPPWSGWTSTLCRTTPCT